MVFLRIREWFRRAGGAVPVVTTAKDGACASFHGRGDFLRSGVLGECVLGFDRGAASERAGQRCGSFGCGIGTGFVGQEDLALRIRDITGSKEGVAAAVRDDRQPDLVFMPPENWASNRPFRIGL